MRTLRQLGNRKKKVTIWVHVDRYGRTHHPFMRQVEKLDYEVDLIELATIGGQPVKYCMGVTLDIKFGAADNTPEAAPRIPSPTTNCKTSGTKRPGKNVFSGSLNEPSQ